MPPVTPRPVGIPDTQAGQENKPERFFSRVPGSTYVFGDGTRVIFAHGYLDLSEELFPGTFHNLAYKDHPDNGKPRYKAYKEELDRLVKEGNPLIFTQETVSNLQELPRPEIQARSEAEIARQDQNLRRIAQTSGGAVETGERNVGDFDPNKSTVDTDLQARMFAPRPEAQGTRSVEAIRAAAAARTQNTTPRTDPATRDGRPQTRPEQFTPPVNKIIDDNTKVNPPKKP